MALRALGLCAALVAALFVGMGCPSGQPGGEAEPVVTGPPPGEPEEEALMPTEAVAEPGAPEAAGPAAQEPAKKPAAPKGEPAKK